MGVHAGVREGGQWKGGEEQEGPEGATGVGATARENRRGGVQVDGEMKPSAMDGDDVPVLASNGRQ